MTEKTKRSYVAVNASTVLRNNGITLTKLADVLNVSVASVHRALAGKAPHRLSDVLMAINLIDHDVYEEVKEAMKR